MERTIASSKFVLVVCTAIYLRRWNNDEKPGVGLGAQWESLLTRQHLTDTSNGFRALRVDVLRDVTLQQDQYQTAELIISAAMRGWRLADRPVLWHPRVSGESKKGHNVFFALQYARVIVQTWWRDRR